MILAPVLHPACQAFAFGRGVIDFLADFSNTVSYGLSGFFERQVYKE